MGHLLCIILLTGNQGGYFMKTQLRLIILFLILTAGSMPGRAQSVSITGITPESPSRLSLNEDVTINFTYTINEPGGVRIYIRPITSGQLTPNYSASGSPVYANGRGRGTVRFTITEGTATVDQLRVQVRSERQRQLLFQFLVPVKYTFSSSITYLPVIPKTFKIPKTLKVIPEELQKGTPQDTTTKSEEIVKKTVKPDGTLEVYYADGTIMGIISEDVRYYIDPATGDTSYTQLFYSEVQGAQQPADPPGLTADSPNTVNEEWLNSLNAWIEYLGYQLLNRINLYLEEGAFENYKAFEENNSSTIYEKVNLRYTFLEKLLMSDQ